MIKACFQVLLTVLAFLTGAYFRIRSQAPAQPCALLSSGHQAGTLASAARGGGSICCSVSDARYTVHRNDLASFEDINKRVFAYSPHPKSPSLSQMLVSMDRAWRVDGEDPLGSGCTSVYMQRSPTRADQETKCFAVVQTRAKYVSPFALANRNGSIAWPQILTHQYQDDWIRFEGLVDEATLIVPMLQHLDELVALLEVELGPAVSEAGVRRTAIIMVANEGVIDLVLNFVCSCRSASIDLSTFIVFVAQKEHLSLIRSFGVKAFYNEYLGKMPSSSRTYADHSFSRLMWFKASTVYLVVAAGWNVLFQDADVIWLKDPIEHIKAFNSDMVYMDDGIRSPRFSPFFINSGFYYLENNAKTRYMQERFLRMAGEISFSHSHQQGFIRHITEAHYLFGVQIQVLDKFLFPSGYMYHHEKPYMRKIINHKVFPFAFHMNFNDNRKEKITRFAEYGMWFLPPWESKDNVCESGKTLLEFHSAHPDVSLVANCCKVGGFWTNFPKS